jgi:DNA polymerase elongation subunit (family B)
VLLEDYRKRLALRSVPVEEIARSETLSQNPDAYARFIEQGGKPRRASAEAALQLSPRPRMGDRVTYYISAASRAGAADWQRARAAALFDPDQAPYDPHYYIAKLDDWLARYGGFLGVKPPQESVPVQGELF